MQTLYPLAKYRPLSSRQTEPSIGTPRVLIFHTMVGNLSGTDNMFKRDGYSGTESHFGVGGPWESPSLDGVVYQWQPIDHQADAQWDGNAYATSIETADGGNPNNKWTALMLDALVRLGVWWCKATGNPATLVSSPSGRGIGYHCQFGAWNRSAHTCPGKVRLDQLLHNVIPSIHAEVAGGTFVLKRYLRLESPMMHGADVTRCQAKVGCKTDGYFGAITKEHVVAYQKAHRLIADGVVGPDTARSFGWSWQG
jgi:peptidoglycan hydrolase-like protein with peptidoglycan-binding domain